MSWVYILLFGAPFIGGVLSITSGFSNEKLLQIFLAFAGGYIFSITLLHVLPEIFATNNHNISLYVLAGFFFQVLVTRISDGAEHGHMHVHEHTHNMALPLGLFLSMCLHAFTEGLPLGVMHKHEGMNETLALGIALHELPAAFALLTILQSEHVSKKTIWALLIAYALMAPAGMFISSIASNYLPEILFSRLLAFVAGVFLFISTTILFENSENHRFSSRKLVAIFIGLLLAIGMHQLAHQHA
jgi:zinc and cadmium transporter